MTSHIRFAFTSLFVAGWLVILSTEGAAQRAVPRGGGGSAPSSGDSSGGSSGGSGGSGGSAPQGARAPSSSPRSSSEGGQQRAASGARASAGDGGQGVVGAAGARPREGSRVTGTAVPRSSLPPGGGGGNIIVVPPYYPSYPYYGYGHPWYGYGYGWGYGGFGFSIAYSNGFYGPWGYPYGGVAYAPGPYDGALRLRVTPADATVYVDGYYAGRVEDFDGTFQRLHLEPGPHQVEIKQDGFETLTFEVKILPDRTITYTGDMKKP